ncbi:DNA mismatch repair endonuclease MutL [Desulfocicer niacini]
MGDIRVLPELITNQIAAGEVVERPVSVVKELMENALDAHATHIRVEVDRGGRDLIRVSDDGDGMSHDNALLCIERYATSKIATADDLFSIATLGFRGEALPSIASVSKMTITTREQGADYGTRLFLSGGKLMEVSEIGAAPGTVVDIRSLYFNTPVRRKFLKTVNTEMGHIADAFAAMAMGAVGVGFSLIHNGRLVKDISCDQALESRVASVLGTDASVQLYPLDLQFNGVGIKGYIAHPAHTRSSSQRIRLFVNGRMVTDKGIVSALLQGFRGRIMKGRFPMAVLFLTLPFDGVDVNVHPSKLQVRFVNGKGVYHAVRRAVSDALVLSEQKDASLVSREMPSAMSTSQKLSSVDVTFAEFDYEFQVPDDQDGISHSQPSVKEGEPGNEIQSKIKFENDSTTVPASLFKWGRSANAENYQKASFFDIEAASDSSLKTHGDTVKKKSDDSLDIKKLSTEAIKIKAGLEDGPVEHGSVEDDVDGGSVEFENKQGKTISPRTELCLSTDAAISNTLADSLDMTPGLKSHARIVGQVLGTYIVIETLEGVVFIDQHAAHERIVYESLRKRSKTFRPPSQHLLVPEVLDLNFSQSALLEKMIPALCELGFDIEPFGGTTFALKAVPAIIDHCDVRQLIQDMVDSIMESGLESGDDAIHGEAWLEDCLVLMACHNSVRANQTMNEVEMADLICRLDECENAFYCPHGRPIRVVWSQRDFERMFKRVV